MEDEITMPDFVMQAEYVHTDGTTNAIQTALEQAFHQGRYLGRREGYEQAKNEWWIEQDREVCKLIRDTGEQEE